MRRLVAVLLIGCGQGGAPAPDSASAQEASAPPTTASAAPSASASAPTSEPEKTFALMQAAACDANVAQFFKRIDQKAVEDAAFDAVLQEMKKKLGRDLTSLERTTAEAELAKERGNFFKEWEKDIDRGSKGFICQWEKVSVDGWKIRIKRASGTSLLTFAERDGEVKLIGYAKQD